MDNQHRQIKGYRELSQAEIDLMNEIKTKGAELGELVEKLRKAESLDQRWVSVGATDLQKGLMSLTRSREKLKSFVNELNSQYKLPLYYNGPDKPPIQLTTWLPSA